MAFPVSPTVLIDIEKKEEFSINVTKTSYLPNSVSAEGLNSFRTKKDVNDVSMNVRILQNIPLITF